MRAAAGAALRAELELDARVRKPRNFGNPGAFDYAALPGAPGHLLDRLRRAPAPCASCRALRLALPEAPSWTCAPAALDRLERLYPRQRLPDRHDAGPPDRPELSSCRGSGPSIYRCTGTFHALVISGTHVAILAAFFLLLLRICFVPESVAMLVTVLAAWLYALVTGWQAPCVRSAAGLTLFMIVRLLLPPAPRHESAGGGGAWRSWCSTPSSFSTPASSSLSWRWRFWAPSPRR